MVMLRTLFAVLCIVTAVAEEPATPSVNHLVTLTIENASLFADVPAIASVRVPHAVAAAQLGFLPRDTADISFLRQDTNDNPADDKDTSTISLTFLPRSAGLIVLPALEWEHAGHRYHTAPTQLSVGSLQRSDAMQLTITPAKTTMYAGEPLRVDISWTCSLPAASLRQLVFNLPFAFRDDVQIDVPRPTIDKELQMGMPVAGRRVIAKRDTSDHPNALGQVTVSMFIRMANAGTYEFDAARLELFRVLKSGGRFAPYAAYFNNALFDLVDREDPCEYLFTESEPFTIEVLPLPEAGQTEAFSGLFAPCRVETTINPTSGEIGQLMELSVRVYAEASSGFLALPDLSRQVGLRHRFWVESEPRKIWHPDGAEFLTRFRPLTNTIRAFPALSFQLFDPSTGNFVVRETAAIPLAVSAKDGQTYFQFETELSDESNLTDQPNGIWHNDRADSISDMINGLMNLLANGFWLWIAVIVAATAGLWPVMQEWRRRAIDPLYRQHVIAYQTFCSVSGGDEAKRQAFRTFLAALSHTSDQAFTIGDARQLWQRHDLAAEDLKTVSDLFYQDDATKYNQHPASASTPELGALAKRIFHRVQSTQRAQRARS